MPDGFSVQLELAHRGSHRVETERLAMLLVLALLVAALALAFPLMSSGGAMAIVAASVFLAMLVTTAVARPRSVAFTITRNQIKVAGSRYDRNIVTDVRVVLDPHESPRLLVVLNNGTRQRWEIVRGQEGAQQLVSMIEELEANEGGLDDVPHTLRTHGKRTAFGALDR